MVDPWLVIRLLDWFRDAAYKEQPVESGSTLVFRVNRPARYFFAGGTLFAAVLAVLSFFIQDIERQIQLGLVLLAALFFARWPWAVKLSPDGVSKRTYFGFTKTIPWMDVIALEFNRKTGIFTVTSKFGQKMRCSAFMVSPARFYAEMYKRASGLGPMPTRAGLPSGSYLPVR